MCGKIPEPVLEENGMRKLAPVLLSLLMMTSVFASIGWQELEENAEFENTSGRSGPDVEVVEITHPRESTEADAFSDARNIVDAGEELYFESWIQNSGNESITQLGVEVSVFERKVNGQVGTFVNSWSHPDVICPDPFVCAQNELLPGAILDFGAFVMSVQGSMVTWTPPVGDYYVYVEATTSDANGDSNDADEDNNVQRNRVIVADWTDLSVDLEWTSGKDVEGGQEPVDFTMTIMSEGSIPWDARNVIVHLTADGAMQNAAFWSDENDDTADHHNNASHREETTNALSLGTPYNFSEIGTYGSVLIFQNASDPNDNQSDDRWNLRTGVPWVLNGTVTPNAAAESGDYSLTATIIEFTEYGRISPECDSEGNADLGDGANNDTGTTTNWCEVSRIKDDNSESQTSTITGSVENRHDISIDRLVMNTGYMVQPDGAWAPADNTGLTAGPVSPGPMTIEAMVMHRGNNPGAYDEINDEYPQEYDWNVTFTITNRSDNSVEEFHAENCSYGELYGTYGPYATIGGMGAMEGRACIQYDMWPGLYDITATANLIGKYTGFDATSFNDAMTIQSVSALNNRPVVTATLGNSGTIYASAEDGVSTPIEISASASDVEDSNEKLKISWDLPGDMFDQDTADQFNVGITPLVNSDWIGKGRTATVTVEDTYGLRVSDIVTFDVWHKMTASDESESGVNLSYHIEYADDTPFGVTLTDSTDTFTGKALTGFSGTYDSIAVLDYTPSTLYSAGDLLNSQMTLKYDTTSLEPTSVWFVNPNGNWALLASTDEISVIGTEGTVTLPASGEDILGNGQIVLMGGTVIMEGIPELHPMTMTLNPQSGGKIGMQWSYMLPSGATVAGNEYYHLVVCEGADDCAENDRVLDTTGSPDTANNQDSYTLTGTSTTHSSMYYATVSICNNDGCHETVAKNSATADKEVDGHPTATNMVVNANAGMTAWDVTWETDGDTSDVKMWRVCYSDSSWNNAGDMPSTCVDAADGETSVSAPMSEVVGKKKFYFTAVPVDALGNYDTAVSLYDVNYERTSDGTVNTGDTISDQTAAEGDVPTWAWGAIIGIVAVAFVVGAFILSRGGDGDEGKDWDY